MGGPFRQVIAPVTSARQQAAERPQGEQQRRRSLACPAPRRTRPRSTSAAPKSRPSARQTTVSGTTVRHGRAGAVRAGRRPWVGRGLGGPLGGEVRGCRPDRRDGQCCAQPGDRMHRGGQHRDDDRAEHEDGLVGDRLERERCLDVALGSRARAPTGRARELPTAGSAAHRRRRQDVRRRDRPVRLDRPHEQRQAGPPDRDHDGQHPGLAEPVEQPALQDRESSLSRSAWPPTPRRRARRSRSRSRPAARCPAPPSTSAAARPDRSR